MQADQVCKQEGLGAIEMPSYQVVPMGAQPVPCSEPDDNPFKKTDTGATRVYRRRWIMLFLFVFVSAINAFHWIQLSIITSVVVTYFGVSEETVDWTSMVFMLSYIPLIFPGAWIMDKMVLLLNIIHSLWIVYAQYSMHALRIYKSIDQMTLIVVLFQIKMLRLLLKCTNFRDRASLDVVHFGMNGGNLQSN